MGLDKHRQSCLNGFVRIKLLLRSLGLGFLLGGVDRKSPITKEREHFEQGVKEQLLKLKEKGLSIPVFTL